MSEEREDYCSGVPDGDWGDACRVHDEEYEAGGTLLDKWRADARLAWAIATSPAENLPARIGKAGLGMAYGFGVVVLHKYYKLWGMVTGKKVGFRYK